MKHIPANISMKSASGSHLLSGVRTCRFDQTMAISIRYFKTNGRYTDLKNIGKDYSRAKRMISRELDLADG